MEIEVEGKSIEEAIQEGLKKLGVSKDQVDVKILNEGSTGLFGLMGTKPACVRLSIKGSNADLSLTQTRAKEVLIDLFKLMNIKYSEINTALLTGRVYVNVKSDDSRFIIGKNGNSLEALDHILNLILHKDEKTRTKVSLDVEGYRKQQESRLQTIAMKAAEEVKQTGKPYRFDPMPSDERRLIHMFLKNDPSVESVSEGEGRFRKIVLLPRKKADAASS